MSNDVFVDVDREADVLYVLKRGYEDVPLQNVDSEKIAGVVKRLVPGTGECVGFIIESFSHVLPVHSRQPLETLRATFAASIELTNRVARSASDAERLELAV